MHDKFKMLPYHLTVPPGYKVLRMKKDTTEDWIQTQTKHARTRKEYTMQYSISADVLKCCMSFWESNLMLCIVFILASTLFSPRVSLLLFDVIFLYFNISNGFHGWVTMQAEAIGKGGQDFMLDLNMKRVYDYMYHLIMEYSKLQDFRPVPPSSAQEMCGESLLCFADPNQRKFLKNSYATPSSLPCTLPLPDRHSVERWMQKKKEIINGIEKLEKMQTGKGGI